MLIVKFSDGRASGDAFAVFDSDINLEKALEKDKTSMGSRYVELFRSSVKEFQLVRWLCFSNHVPPSTGVILLQVYLAKMVLFSPLHFILLPLLSSLLSPPSSPLPPSLFSLFSLLPPGIESFWFPGAAAPLCGHAWPEHGARLRRRRAEGEREELCEAPWTAMVCHSRGRH